MTLHAVLHAAPHNAKSVLVTSIMDAFHVPYTLYEYSEWHSHADKITTAYRATQELTDASHLLFLDAYDVLVLGTPEAILEQFVTLKHPWVCAAEINLWPPHSFHPSDYGDTFTTPWRYLNSGVYLAERTYLAACLERWGIPEEAPSDQAWYAEHYLQDTGSILLDTQCTLFQCLISSWWAFEVSPGRLYNNYTRTHPLILHDNGGARLTRDRVRVLWEGVVKCPSSP